MRTVYANTIHESIYLGRQGENEAQQVIFDVEKFPALYGAGVASVVAKRKTDAASYVATNVVQSDTEVIWTLTSVDTGVAGFGSAELRWMVGDVLAKSVLFKTRTDPSLVETGSTPSPYDDVLPRVSELVAEANQAVVDSQQAVTEAQNAATEAKEAAAQIEADLPKWIKDVDGTEAESLQAVVANNVGSNTVSGQYAFASGNETEATNFAAHAEGHQTHATGQRSHAEGSGTTASGNLGSHAEGFKTTASGNNGSHAEGQETTASGSRAHAQGQNTTASGVNSHAEGYGTVASGNASHAQGANTIAASQQQHVFGRWNVEDASSVYIEIAGNGTQTARRNARTLDWNGNEVLMGRLTLGRAPANDMDAATKKYVDDLINKLKADNNLV